ncbi:MFS transporter [Streptomyces sp. NPDC048106]|uniref:MFS transporter n=1 Tax=Streptomyces sp. NPDC048106 TaxID=3155750 RepID=UPI003456297F
MSTIETRLPTGGRFGPLAHRNFRRFYAGHSVSLFGTGMERIAVAFAVLDTGGSASDLGLVIAGGVAANVLCMLAGGVVADRYGRRGVMLASDTLRFLAEGVFATLVLLGHAPVWAMFLLHALQSVGTGFFTPAMAGLVPDIVPAGELQRANVLLGLAKDIGVVAGPAVAGILIVTTSPGTVLGLDALTYLVSVIAVAVVKVPPYTKRTARSPLGDLREGFGEWRRQTWIWLTSVTFALFNGLLYAPFLVLGPIVAKEDLGGSDGWGVVLAALGAGSILAAPMLMRWSPGRPVVVIILAQAAWAIPVMCLAVPTGLPFTVVAAFIGGAALAVFNAIWTTLLQRKVPGELIARVSSFDAVCSYSLSPIGLVAAAVVAEAVGGAGVVLWAAALWQVLSAAALLTLPAVRRVTL